MLHDQAIALASTFVKTYVRDDATVAAYATAIRAYDHEPMKAAMAELILEYDRLPSVKHLVGAYYGKVRDAKGAVEAEEDPPCFFCARDGGWRLEPGGRLWAPRSSIPPFTGKQRHTDRDGSDLGPVWDHPPACSAHAKGLAMSKPRRSVFHTPDPATVAEWQGRYAEEARAWESASTKAPQGPMADVVVAAKAEVAPVVAVSSQTAPPAEAFALQGDPDPISGPLVAPAPKSDPGWAYPKGPSPGMTQAEVDKFDQSCPF